MTLLFIDTQTWLNAYRVSQHPPSLAAIKALPTYRDVIISSDFQVSEFLKGRAQAIQKGIQELNQNHAPPVLHAWKKSERIEQGRSYLPMIMEDYTLDGVYQILRNLEHGQHFHQLNSSDGQDWLEKAKRRMELNMAPSKAKDPTIGDQIHWLTCIESCKADKKNLVICTSDQDFGQLGSPGRINDSLRREFQEALGTGSQVQIYSNLNLALRQLDVPTVRELRPYQPYKGSIPDLLKD